jgi:flavin-dependent dehydrogenase
VTRTWDALVVGAGPAGSVAARELARRGLTVLLADKATFPREKVCGCCLNGSALDTLRRLGLGDLPARLGAVPLGRVRLAAGGRAATLAVPGGVALSRRAFDDALIAEAVAAGAEFRSATTVKRVSDGWVTRSASDRADSRSESATRYGVVVVADGLNGQLTATSEVRAGSRIGAGAVAADAPDAYEPGTIFMATGRGGYVGLVRLEDGRLDVAAAFDAGFVRSAGGPGPAAVAVLAEAGLPPVPGLADLGWRGTPPLTRAPRRRAGPGWFAVGDAAGYVEPFTGEGMAWAVASAAAVAPLAERAARHGWSPAFERDWEDAYARVVGARQGVCRAAARVLRSPRLTRLSVNVLSLVPALAGPVLARLNRPSQFTTEVVA